MLSMFDAALYHYDVGLKVDERLGNVSHAAVIHNNIGEVLLAIGRLDEAVAHLEFVVSAHRADSSLAGLTGLAEVNLTRCLLLRGDIDGAKSRLRRGLRLLRSAGVEGLLTEAHLQRAELHLAVGDVLRARRECRRALRDIRTRETKVLEARAERLLGKVEASLGKTALARAHLRTSISIAHRTGAGFEEAVSLRELGTILHAVPATRARAAGILARASRILSKMGAALDPPADGHVSPG
jgi:tetratricopeptide (TPR) repeat protein